MPKRNHQSAEQLNDTTTHERGDDAATHAVSAAQTPGANRANSPARITRKAARSRGDNAGVDVASDHAPAVPTMQTPSPIVYRQMPVADANAGNVSDLWRIPNYEQDGKTDRNSRVFAGQVMETLDWVQQAEANYGAGYYVKVPRLSGGKFGREMFVYVPPMSKPFAEGEDLFVDELDEVDEFGSVPSEPMMTRREWQRERELIQIKAELDAMKRYGGQANAAQRPKSMLEETIEEIAAQRIREVLTVPNPAPALSQVESPKRNGDMFAEAVLTSVLKNQDLSINDAIGLIAALKGQSPSMKDEAEGEGFMSMIVKQLVESAPAIIQSAIPLFTAGATAPPQMATGAATEATAPMNAPAMPLPPQTAQPSFQDQTFQHVIGTLIDSIAHNKPNRAAISAADYLIQNFPEGAAVEQFLNQDAQTLAQFLASFSPEAAQAVSQPHAIQWIEGFLNDFFGAEDEGEAPTVPDAPKAEGASA